MLPASIFHLHGWWYSFLPNSAPWHSYQDLHLKWHSRVDLISHHDMVCIRAVTRWSLSLSHAQNPLIRNSLTHRRWTQKPPPPSPHLLAWKSRLRAAWSLQRSQQRGGGQSRPLPSTRSGAGSILPGLVAAAASQDSGRPQGPARCPGPQRAGCGTTRAIRISSKRTSPPRAEAKKPLATYKQNLLFHERPNQLSTGFSSVFLTLLVLLCQFSVVAQNCFVAILLSWSLMISKYCLCIDNS